MSSKHFKARMTLLLFLLGVAIAVPAFAGSAVIGSAAGSMNATLGGQALVPNTTIFSGDSLQVRDGAAVVAIGNSSRMVFGRETIGSFLRDADEVTLLLAQGNVSLYHPDDSVALRVRMGSISVMPVKGFKTLGEVAMIGGAVVVTTKEGLLRVEGSGPAVEVAKGKTITVMPKSARAPAAGAGGGVSSSTAFGVASVAASGLAAVLGGVAISRASDAKDSASSAATVAGSAVTSAQAAATAAAAAQTAANAAGCAVDSIAYQAGFASPILPVPAGCK